MVGPALDAAVDAAGPLLESLLGGNDQQPAEEPATGAPATEVEPAEEAPAEAPAAEEAPVEQPAAEETPVEQPVAEEAPVEQPVAEEVPAEAEVEPAEETLPAPDAEPQLFTITLTYNNQSRTYSLDAGQILSVLEQMGLRDDVEGAYIPESFNFNVGGDIIGEGISAVSYTHLDVYKRQM